jgi:class I fructose-bisphosphate aldolase
MRLLESFGMAGPARPLSSREMGKYSPREGPRPILVFAVEATYTSPETILLKEALEMASGGKKTQTGNNNGDVLKHFRSCSFSTGELARARQIVDDHGKSLILPYDQFIEHDNRHVKAESDAGNPHYIMELAREGRYTGVAVHYGVSARYWPVLEGSVPVIVKINGKTSIPSQAQPLSVHTSYVADAVKVGAVAVGYTMYYGSPRQDVDLPQLATVRQECERYGLPLIVWAYPRGEAMEKKGGIESSYALESAARMAMEMGATIVKSNVPKEGGKDYLENKEIPSYYRELERELQSMPKERALQMRADRVVKATQGIPVLFSGGSEIDDADLLHRAELCVKAGALGFIFGRNMWKREKSKALEITEKLRSLLHELG